MTMQTYSVLNFKCLNTQKAGLVQKQILTVFLKLSNFKISIPALPRRSALIRLRKTFNPRISWLTKEYIFVHQQFKSRDSDWSSPAMHSCCVVFSRSPYIYMAV